MGQKYQWCWDNGPHYREKRRSSLGILALTMGETAWAVTTSDPRTMAPEKGRTNSSAGGAAARCQEKWNSADHLGGNKRCLP